MKIIFSLVFILFAGIVYAQDSPVAIQKSLPDLPLSKAVGWNNGRGYFIENNKGIHSIICIDSEGKLISSALIEEQFEGASYQKTVLLGSNLFSFYFNDEKKERDLRLYAVPIDISTLKSKAAPIKIYDEEGAAKKLPNGLIASNRLFNNITVSENHKYIFISSELTSDSNSVTFIRMCSFDSNMTKLQSSKFYCGKKSFFSIQQFNIDNKGDAFISGFIFTGLYQYYLLHLPKTGKPLYEKIFLSKGTSVSSVYGLSNNKGELIICGSYSLQDAFFVISARGLFYKRYSNKQSLIVDILTPFDTVIVPSKTKNQEIENYSIQKVFFNEVNENLTIIADQYINGGGTNSVPGRSNVFITLLSKSGNLIRSKNINRLSFGSLTANSVLLSIVKYNNSIHVVFNTDERNIISNSTTNKSYSFEADENGCIVDYVFSDVDGTTTNNILWKYQKPTRMANLEYADQSRLLFDSISLLNENGSNVLIYWVDYKSFEYRKMALVDLAAL